MTARLDIEMEMHWLEFDEVITIMDVEFYV